MQNTTTTKAASESCGKNSRVNTDTLTDAQAVTLGAQRLAQAGKKALGARLEAIASNLNGNTTLPVSNTLTATEKAQVNAMSVEIKALQKEREELKAKLATKQLIARKTPIVLALDKTENSKGVSVDIDTTPLDNVPDYVPSNGEFDIVCKAISASPPLNVLLTGPTQCGKTTLALNAVRKRSTHKRECFTIQGGAGASFERIVCDKDLEASNGATITKLNKGLLPIAMERGAVLYVDEPNGIPSEVLFYLFSAMDDRRTITLPNGEVIQAAEGFVVVMAMNEGAGYAGTSLLNSAFRARGKVIEDVHYLPAKREAALIAERTSIDKATATKLADAGEALRAKLGQQGGIKTPIGTSALLACATLLKLGVSEAKALQTTIVNQVPSTYANERKSVQDVLAAFFGKASA